MSFFIQSGSRPLVVDQIPENPTDGQFYLIKDEDGKILYLAIDGELLPVNFDQEIMEDVSPLVEHYNEILKFLTEVEGDLYYKGQPLGGSVITELREVFIYPTQANFPAIGTEQKIYIAMDTGLGYYYNSNLDEYNIFSPESGKIKLTKESEPNFLENLIDANTLTIENGKLTAAVQAWADF